MEVEDAERRKSTGALYPKLDGNQAKRLLYLTIWSWHWTNGYRSLKYNDFIYAVKNHISLHGKKHIGGGKDIPSYGTVIDEAFAYIASKVQFETVAGYQSENPFN